MRKRKEGNNLKSIAIKVDDELHKQVKMMAARKGVPIKEYIMKLIEKDLQKEKE